MNADENSRQEPLRPAEQPDAETADTVGDILSAWRARAARIILAVVAVIGLPAWGTVIWNGLRAGEMSPLLWVYLLVYLSIAALALLPRLDHRLRIWGLLVLGYANGFASLLRLGLTGSGRLYLLLVPVFTTVLVGARAGLITAVISLVTYALFVVQAGAAAAPSWIEAGIALAAFVLSAVVLLGRFSHFQLQILRRERGARSQLEMARQELEAYSRTLEQKVQERTARLAEAKRQAEAANRRFEQELAFAGQIQASFMASELPTIPQWSCAATLLPARQTSGDFYDLFPLPEVGGREALPASDRRYGVLIADVVDKGVGAALFMALCWALLHTYARRYPGAPARVLAAANRRILRDTRADQFVTLFYGILDVEVRTLRYANAGHPPPYHLRRGQVTELARTGIPLGIRENERWTERSLSFEPSDLCLLYTDGVTEAQNRQRDFFGSQRLVSVLRQNNGRSAEAVQAAVLDDVGRFTGDVPQTDDITLLVLALTQGAS